MSILIIGGTGMLGHKLVQVLKRDFEVFSTIRRSFANVAVFGIFDEGRTLSEVDVTDFSRLRQVIEKVRPDVVINAAGVIKHVRAATDTHKMSIVNSALPKKLADFSRDLGFRLICISTDCVFSGGKGHYTEEDNADATDAYGKSKLDGEVAGDNCLTIRTSIIGRELDTAHSLVEWFLSNRNGLVGGYVNAIYTGFPTIIFSELLGGLIKNHPELSGLYHVSSDPISKFDLLQLVGEAYQANIEVVRDPGYFIDRSMDSSKFRAATGFVAEEWKTMIQRMAADPTPYDAFRKA